MTAIARPVRIRLQEADAAAIRAAALAAYPLECCGLMIGEGGGTVRVHRLAPSPNTAPDPSRHFEIDPQFLFDHLRSARETNMSIVGHYHSHPNGRGEPSGQDLAMAHDAGAVWVIAAVTGKSAALRAFVAEDGGFLEIPVEIDR